MNIINVLKTKLRVFIFKQNYTAKESIHSRLIKFLFLKTSRKNPIIIFIVIFLLFILVFIGLHRPNYDGEYIYEISDNDKVCKLLLEDIKSYKEKYNGKGGMNVDQELKVVLYKVKTNETLWNIHQKTGLSQDTLISMNPRKNIHILQPNQEIRIPNRDGLAYKIQEGETLESLAEEFKVEKSDIINVNDFNESSIEDGKDVFIPNARYKLEDMINILGQFVHPLNNKGRITSQYGPRKDPIMGGRSYHYGIDIAYNYGTPVRSAESGKVIFCGTMGGYGNLVIIKHSGMYSTRYGHLCKFAVSYGQKIRQGQVIGYIGSTGNVTGPHLHFEIRKYGQPVNPYFIMRCSK